MDYESAKLAYTMPYKWAYSSDTVRMNALCKEKIVKDKKDEKGREKEKEIDRERETKERIRGKEIERKRGREGERERNR